MNTPYDRIAYFNNTPLYKLTDEESVEELARMLGGVEITDTVMQSAREMKQMAAKVRENTRA